jgi:hypothetical protein
LKKKGQTPDKIEKILEYKIFLFYGNVYLIIADVILSARSAPPYSRAALMQSPNL